MDEVMILLPSRASVAQTPAGPAGCSQQPGGELAFRELLPLASPCRGVGGQRQAKSHSFSPCQSHAALEPQALLPQLPPISSLLQG